MNNELAPGSGNVFRDMDRTDPGVLQLKAELAGRIIACSTSVR